MAGRHLHSLEPLIGFFLNTLPMRTNLGECLNFDDLLLHVKKTVLEAQEHQEVPFEKIVEKVAPERVLNENPIFNILFNMLNQPREESDPSDLKIELAEGFGEMDAKFDLQLYVTETQDIIHGDLLYDTGLFTTERVKQLVNDYQEILKYVLTNPDKELTKINIMSKEEQAREIEDFFSD